MLLDDIVKSKEEEIQKVYSQDASAEGSDLDEDGSLPFDPSKELE